MRITGCQPKHLSDAMKSFVKEMTFSLPLILRANLVLLRRHLLPVRDKLHRIIPYRGFNIFSLNVSKTRFLAGYANPGHG